MVSDRPSPSGNAYHIDFIVNSDGSFDIEGDSFASLKDALLGLVKVVKQHPTSGKPQDEFEAGFAAGPRQEAAGPASSATPMVGRSESE